MLRVWGGFWVGIVCVAALWMGRAACAELCGPLYLDPNTFGGSQVDSKPRSKWCSATELRVEGDAYDMNYAKGWRPLHNMEWFGVLPKCRQVAIGVSINQEVEGGIRGNANSVGISLNTNRTYWGDPEKPTGGWNEDFTSRLKYAGKRSHWPGMWIMVNNHTNQLWYAHPGMEPIPFDLPEIFAGKKLYPQVQVWNSKSLEILHDKPLMSHSCSDSLLFNARSLTGLNSQIVNTTTLEVSYSDAGDRGVAKLGGVLMDGQWIGGITEPTAGAGIGVSSIPYKLKEEFTDNFDNSTYSYLLHDFAAFYNPNEDPTTKIVLYIKVDYAVGKLSYTANYCNQKNSKPLRIETEDLPDSLRNKPLFPVFTVTKRYQITIDRNVPEDLGSST